MTRRWRDEWRMRPDLTPAARSALEASFREERIDPEPDEHPVLLAGYEAAALLGMDVSAVHRLAKADLLPYFLIRKTMFFALEDVREYDDSTPVPGRVRKRVRSRKSINARLRFKILERDGFRCVYCGATAQDGKLAVDHIISVAEGGSDDEANLATACEQCNLGKGRHSLTVVA